MANRVSWTSNLPWPASAGSRDRAHRSGRDGPVKAHQGIRTFADPIPASYTQGLTPLWRR
jgi:hypothetical protein